MFIIHYVDSPDAPRCRDMLMSPECCDLSWHQRHGASGGATEIENQAIMEHQVTAAQIRSLSIKMEKGAIWICDMRYEGMLLLTRISLVRMQSYLSILLHACPMIQFISGPDTSKRIPGILDIFTKIYRHYQNHLNIYLWLQMTYCEWKRAIKSKKLKHCMWENLVKLYSSKTTRLTEYKPFVISMIFCS